MSYEPAPNGRVKLLICETCVRERALAPGELSLGRRLAEAVRRRLPAGGCELRVVACLRGCPRPANVSLRCSGKWSLRFSRLQPSDAAAVVQLAERYRASADGDLRRDGLPQALAGKLSAAIPPPRLAFDS